MRKASVETSGLYFRAAKRGSPVRGLDAIAHKLGIRRAQLDVLRKTDRSVAAVIRRSGGRYFAHLDELMTLVDQRAVDKTAMRRLAVRNRFPGPVRLGHCGLRVFLYLSRSRNEEPPAAGAGGSVDRDADG